MKIARPSIALLLIIGALAGGCEQVEGFLGAAESPPAGSGDASAAGGVGGSILPSNPIPASATDSTGNFELPVDAPADGKAEPAVASEPDWRPPSEPSERFYTTHNLWYESSNSMDTMNYKTGKLLPAGTEVIDVEVIKRRFRKDTIGFKTPADGVPFSISWDSKNHAGWTLDEIKDRMFSGKSFDELTSSLNPLEVESIRRGTLQPGMSRRAVLIAYGYPPSLSTPDLKSRLWKYWVAPARLVSVRFGADHRTVLGSGVKE